MSKTEREIVVQSVISMAKAILDSAALEKHKRDYLNNFVWKITEANGKHNLRYWSEEVYTLVQQHNSVSVAMQHALIQHEHIYPRAYIADQILKFPSKVEEIYRKMAIACLVTKSEHDRLRKLDKSVIGFARYKAAQIQIWDRETQDWLKK